MAILTSRIPRGKKIDAAREIPGFQDAENDSQRSQNFKGRGETESDHHGTPQQGNSRQKDARADFADEDRRRRLEDDVGDEEDKRGDRLGV